MPTQYGRVRGNDAWQAEQVAEMLERHFPAVVAELPDSSARSLEVWLQPSPQLYRLWASTNDDADGFWADGPGRIHLRERADNVERTLVHELVHAALGDSWDTLPGTMEEGLCDALSARLCPGGAVRMRAGRLSSAAFATGGMGLDLELVVQPAQRTDDLRICVVARVHLHGAEGDLLDPMEIFERNAGLSTTRMDPERKKAYYGLSFMLMERIVDRIGLEGLHGLCLEAAREGRKKIPTEWLLEAADLSPDFASWRRALLEALGPAELGAMVRMHPSVIAEVVQHHLVHSIGLAAEDASLEALGAMEARLSIVGGGATIDLTEIHGLRRELLSRR